MSTEEQTVQTAYGPATMQALIKAYEKKREYEANKTTWLKSEEGKAYNRQKAKEYYERNREKVLQKRLDRYAKDKEILLQRSMRYYEENRDTVCEKNRARRQLKKTQEGTSDLQTGSQ